MSRAGAELADIIKPYDVDIVATVATMGIPLVVEVTRHLGLDQYVILHKTPKIHLADAVSEPVRSITTDAEQRLLFDRARIKDVRDKRVAIVDDVISTGASTGAALRLLRGVGADIVAIGTLVTEASLWREALGEDAHKVRALGSIPVFSSRRIGWSRRGLDGLGPTSSCRTGRASRRPNGWVQVPFAWRPGARRCRSVFRARSTRDPR